MALLSFSIISILLLLIPAGLGKSGVREISLAAIFFVLIIFFGFRDGYGTDFYPYLWIYDAISAYPYLAFTGAMVEPGFGGVVLLLAQLGLPNYSISLVSFFVTSLFSGYACYKYSPNVALSILILIAFGFLGASLNILRHAMAFSIVVLSLFLVRDNKHFLFLIVVVFASFAIHKMAFVMALIPYADKFKINRFFWYVLLLCSILLYFFSDLLFGIVQKFLSVDWFPYAHYFESDWTSTSRNSTYLNRIVLIVVAVWIISVMPKIEENRFWAKMAYSYLFGFMLTTVFVDYQGVVRGLSGLTWLSFLVIPYAIYSYSKLNNRIIVTLALSVYSAVLLFVFIRSHSSSFVIGNYLFGI